nr:uncharacterized protein LOC109778577 [Aegilops tauschii subsp. strangulata]
MHHTRHAAATAKEAAAAASATAKRPRSPSPPPRTDTIPEADYDLSGMSPNRRRPEEEDEEEDEDTETLAQRVAKRARTSTGDEPPTSSSSAPEGCGGGAATGGAAKGNRQHASSIDHYTSQGGVPGKGFYRRAHAAKGEIRGKALPDKPTRAEEPAGTGAGGAIPAMNVGWEGTTPPQLVVDLTSAGQMDVDGITEEIAKDAAAEANKVAADEAAKEAHEEAARGSTREASKRTGDRTDDFPASGVPGTTSVPEPSAAWATVAEDHPSTSKPPTRADT